MPAMITPRQLEILQHSLGVNAQGRGRMYRNHFCAGPQDEEDCRQLVAAGYMILWSNADPKTGRVPNYPYYNVSVTDLGKKYVQENPGQ